MIKNLFFAIFIFLFCQSYGQQNVWSKTAEKNVGKLRERGSRADAFQLYTLKKEELAMQLSKAPDRDAVPLLKGILVKFPDIKGDLITYEVLESSTMHPDLQNRYAAVRSYMGAAVGDPHATVRFTMDPYFGLNASFKNKDGMFYLESYTKDNAVYILYNRKNATSKNSFQCMMDETALIKEISGPENQGNHKTVEDGIKRRYRLAITTSTEYSNYVATQAGLSAGTDAQKKTAVLAAVNLAVARLNQIFENDISSRLILIPNTDLLFFLTADTFNVPDTNQMLGENITVTNAIIGSGFYDLGHIFYQGGGGGLASTPSVCGGSKAGGVTGTDIPVGDPFVIDYVAHEMGHQFGANHTQNNGCNRSAATSVEAGSASSIMGYAGICAPDVQPHSDAYFHAISIKEMYNTITNAGNCALNTPSGNTEPSAYAGKNRSIPKETPFVLTGQGSDPDGDAITYCFEQMDKEVAPMPPKPGNSAGPLFRSVLPTATNTRYFPRLSTIVAGYDAGISNTGDYRTWEKLPAVSRVLNFSLLVRDNNPFGGQTARSDVKLTVHAGAGPFVVTSQNTSNTVWNMGKSETITWNVANTDAAPVSTSNVTILLSRDNGLTFPIVLAASTPNNGTYTFTVPKELGKIENNARIMIKAIDNVFLNVNAKAFSINSSEPPVRSSFLFPDITIYPVPSYDGFVYIKAFTTLDLTYSVFTMEGRLIMAPKTLLTGEIFEKIDLTWASNGAYLLRIENETGTFTKKIIIAK